MSKYVLLHYLSKTGIWQQIALEPGIFNIGRSGENNLVLDDWMVSRQHVSLRVDEQGVWIIDHGSSNGIIIANKLQHPYEWVPLPLDEDFIIGVTTLRVQDLAPAEPEPADPESALSSEKENGEDPGR